MNSEFIFGIRIKNQGQHEVIYPKIDARTKRNLKAYYNYIKEKGMLKNVREK